MKIKNVHNETYTKLYRRAIPKVESRIPQQDMLQINNRIL
jgi:hypothetical protein